MKIICFTGTRADYGIFRPLLSEINKNKFFNLELVVTGMHLVNEYGKTIEEIKKDGFRIIATPSILFKGSSTYAMSQSIGIAILYFSDILEKEKPDCILILGDRGEMLAAAIAAHYQNIAIAHLHGGEISGSADDSIRHAISKLAHIHFVSTIKSKENLILMGEEEWRIHPVGSFRKSDINAIKNLNCLTKRDLFKKYMLSSNLKNLLILMHPDSKDKLSFTEQITPLLNVLKKIEQVKLIFIGPNSDAGGDIFRDRIISFVKKMPNADYFASIPANDYLFLLSQVNLLIGNSSSGIIEAPFFNLTTINIGNRQKSREESNNVVNIENDEKLILKKVVSLLNEENKVILHNPYDLVKNPEKETIKHLTDFLMNQNLIDKYFARVGELYARCNFPKE